jgi:phosphatidylglycerol lysyltransferase
VSDANWVQLAPYLEKYGRGCLSYSVLQQGMEYYIEEGVGFIAYYSFRHFLLAPLGRKIVLADPVCAPDQVEGMLERFIALHKRVILLQCTTKTAKAMDALGYEANMFGKECELPIPFELAGKNRAKIRQWRNKCEREGVVVEERAISDCDLAEVERLSAQWIQEKGGKELILLTRPFVKQDEPGVRCFWARKDGRLIGLAIFDPMYNNGRVVGYYHNFDRITADAPNGTSVYIILEAMKVFAEENVKVVSLGLMPLYVLRAHFRQNDFTMKGLRYAAKNLNNLYPFQGNVSHKKKFHGRHLPVYFSSTNGNQLREMFILMKAMKMI